MALSIKDAETDRLVRRYAAKHATSFTGAIKLAVSNALRQEGEVVEESDQERVAREFMAKVRAIQAEVAKLPVLDPRSPDELVGYDEDGLPN